MGAFTIRIALHFSAVAISITPAPVVAKALKLPCKQMYIGASVSLNAAQFPVHSQANASRCTFTTLGDRVGQCPSTDIHSPPWSPTQWNGPAILNALYRLKVTRGQPDRTDHERSVQFNGHMIPM